MGARTWFGRNGDGRKSVNADSVHSGKELNLPICNDAMAKNNFRVHYASEQVGKSVQLTNKIQIPFENILALYSKYEGQNANDPIAKAFDISSINLGTRVLEFSDRFNEELAKHISKNKDYYFEYWDAEIKTLCTASVGVSTPQSAAFTTYLENYGVCPSIKSSSGAPGSNGSSYCGLSYPCPP